MFHDLCVCIELGKGNAISRNPLPQTETSGSKFGRHHVAIIKQRDCSTQRQSGREQNA
jgi:hypothetical protein